MFDQAITLLSPYLTLFGDEKWKQAVIVVAVFFLAAWILGYLINKFVGLFATRTENVIDEEIIRHLRRPVIWTIFLLGMIYAGTILGLGEGTLSIAKSAVASIITLVWASFAVKAFKLMLTAIVKRADQNSLVRNETLPLFNNLIAIIIYAVAVYFLFQAWGINMTAWLASAGVAGIAIGFAAKDTLANLISGVLILADSPYKIGDYVVLDDDSRGKITHIGIRSTRMVTRDDVEITVPNSIMGNSKIVNQTGGPHPKYRIRIKVGVAYGTKTALVEQVLLEEASKESLVCKYPTPRVRFRSFGNSSLDYQLLCWIDEPELRGRAIHHLNTNIYNAFIKHKIEIPYSKQDIYIKELPK